MRGAVGVAFVAVLVLSGCLAPAAKPKTLFCPGDAGGAGEPKTFVLLVPHDAPQQARPLGERATTSINALEGQFLTAKATWKADGGAARAWFPYEGGATYNNSNEFSWRGTVHAGTYTLEVEGAPLAFGPTVSLTLFATGCSPSPQS